MGKTGNSQSEGRDWSKEQNKSSSGKAGEVEDLQRKKWFYCFQNILKSQNLQNLKSKTKIEKVVAFGFNPGTFRS